MPPTAGRRDRRWLAEIAAAAGTVATQPAFEDAVLSADTAWQPTRTGDGRADGRQFEDLLRPRLIEATGIGAQAAAAYQPGGTLGRLNGVEFVEPSAARGGAHVYDIGMLLVFERLPVSVPVNIKRSRTASHGDEAVNLTTAFHVALGHGASDTSTLDLPATRLGFWAKRHKVSVADYLLLCVEGDGPTLGWHFQGILTGTSRGGLAATLHPTREKLRYRSTTDVIGDDVDINTEIAAQWGPGYQPSVLREQLLLAARAAGASPATVRRLAGVLLDAGDSDVAAGVEAALSMIESLRADREPGLSAA